MGAYTTNNYFYLPAQSEYGATNLALYDAAMEATDGVIAGLVAGSITNHWIPSADDTYDLGSSSYEWKDLYLDGTANIDTLDVSGNATIGGTLTVSGVATFNGGTLTLGDANTDNVVFTADVDSHIIPDDDDTYDLGSSGQQWRNLYIDGTANIDSLVADTADINGGTLSGITIDGNWTAASQTCADLGTVTTCNIDGGTVDGITSLTVGNNVDIGNYDLRCLTITADSLTSGRVPFASTNGQLVDDADFTFATDTLTVTKIAATTITGKLTAGAVEIEGSNFDIDGGDISAATISGGLTWSAAQDMNNQNLTNIDIDSGAIDGTTIGANSAAAGTFANLTASGTVAVTANTLYLGDNADTDKTIEADNGDAANPAIKYDSSDNAWQFTNDGSLWKNIGSGGTVDITQATHGFAVGDVLYLNSTTYAKAKADAVATAEVCGIVTVVTDVNNFTMSLGGKITGLSGLTAGAVSYLSDATAGAMTETAPTDENSIVKPILIADTTTTGYFFNMRGSQITDSTSSYYGSFTNSDLSSGDLTITHNLGHKYLIPTIYDNNDQVAVPDDFTATSTTVMTVDLSSYGTISGTWHYALLDMGGGNVTMNKITDDDGDTQIQTEESADEDTIRFDIAGTETMTLDANTLDLKKGQIKFPASVNLSADANTLDDYEEGTFTPDLQFGGAKVGITYNSSYHGGKYVKLGPLVFFTSVFVLTSKGSSNGSAAVFGIPFTIAAGSNGNTYVTAAIYLANTSFADRLQVQGAPSGTALTIKEVTNAGVVTDLTDADFANDSECTITGLYWTDS